MGWGKKQTTPLIIIDPTSPHEVTRYGARVFLSAPCPLTLATHCSTLPPQPLARKEFAPISSSCSSCSSGCPCAPHRPETASALHKRSSSGRPTSRPPPSPAPAAGRTKAPSAVSVSIAIVFSTGLRRLVARSPLSRGSLQHARGAPLTSPAHAVRSLLSSARVQRTWASNRLSIVSEMAFAAMSWSPVSSRCKPPTL